MIRGICFEVLHKRFHVLYLITKGINPNKLSGSLLKKMFIETGKAETILLPAKQQPSCARLDRLVIKRKVKKTFLRAFLQILI